MKKSLTVFNFDHIYEMEHFYQNQEHQWIDMTDLSGVNGYVDEISMEEIKRRLTDIKPTYFNYIDSGNYHYMTYLLMERVKQPFTLVLFDHHTDMMPSRFGNLLSCGCWVKWALDENKYLKAVILVGVEDHLLDTVEEKYINRIYTYSQSHIDKDEEWQQAVLADIKYPAYISVDKDVIDEDEAKTNWDQGSLTLHQLDEMLHKIREEKEIVGVDVCGEGRIESTFLEQSYLNDRANEMILGMI